MIKRMALGENSEKRHPARRKRELPMKEVRVIIIGGSVAGLCCAHALLKSGVCRVMVLERARSPTAAGAGIAIDTMSCEAFEAWGLRDSLFRMSKPLDTEENRAADTETHEFRTLVRDEEFRHRAIHWSDLHRILYESLPSGIAQFGHEATSFEETKGDGSFVRVSVSVSGEEGDGKPEITKELHGDVIVAADGSLSRTRQFYLPYAIRRYCTKPFTLLSLGREGTRIASIDEFAAVVSGINL